MIVNTVHSKHDEHGLLLPIAAKGTVRGNDVIGIKVSFFIHAKIDSFHVLH